MKGWFDAFRDDGAPTLYSFSNRTPVTGDVNILVVSVFFATLYIAFLVIFPGVRKQVSFNPSLFISRRGRLIDLNGKILIFSWFQILNNPTIQFLKGIQSFPDLWTSTANWLDLIPRKIHLKEQSTFVNQNLSTNHLIKHFIIIQQTIVI